MEQKKGGRSEERGERRRDVNQSLIAANIYIIFVFFLHISVSNNNARPMCELLGLLGDTASILLRTALVFCDTRERERATRVLLVHGR